MTLFGFSLHCKEERQEDRSPATGQFRFLDDEGEEGEAKWCSVAAQGACVCIGRYLRPGRELTIYGDGMELDGRIVWCRPMADKENFVAGVRIVNQARGAHRESVAMDTALLGA